jgi:hypothetical protein
VGREALARAVQGQVPAGWAEAPQEVQACPELWAGLEEKGWADLVQRERGASAWYRPVRFGRDCSHVGSRAISKVV